MKIKNSFPIDLQSGTLKSTPELTFSIWRGLQVLRSRPVPSGPVTASQSAWRSVQPLASSAWSALSAGERKSWETLASERLILSIYGNWRRAGYNEFMSSYMTAVVSGLPTPPIIDRNPTPEVAITFLNSIVNVSFPFLSISFQHLRSGSSGLRFILYAAGPFPSAGRKPKPSEWRLLVPFNFGPSWVIRTASTITSFQTSTPWSSIPGLLNKYCWFRIVPIKNSTSRGLDTTFQSLVISA